MQEKFLEMDSKWNDLKIDVTKVTTLPIRDFITSQHIDIIVKYLYVVAYVEQKNYAKYRALYEKLQLKRIGKCDIAKFNELIVSFQKNGFLKAGAIPINKQNKMLNGSHRLACSLYFNINPYVYYIDEEDHDYPVSWLAENDFTDEEIAEILKVKEELQAKFESHSINLKDVYVALITPLKNNQIDYPYLEKHLNNLQKNGIEGLFICGNTGSGMHLNLNLKRELITYLNSKSSEFSLICHVGSQNLAEIDATIELVNTLDYTAIAAMPPYETIHTFAEIKTFYEKIAKLSNKPVLIYNIPSVTNITYTEKELKILLDIPNVYGIKYTDSNLTKLKALTVLSPNKLYFYGKDDLLLDGLKSGATGGIGGCYNLFPSFIIKIVKEHDLNYQNKLNRGIKLLRYLYPDLPGDEFVKTALTIKKELNDEEFLKYLEENVCLD